jgi:hypothetical protein
MTKDNITMANGRKGMNREVHPSTMQETEYSYMRNGNIEESSGNVMMLQNEPSTLLATRFKEGYKVIGVKADRMSEDTYFFLTNPETGYSEIGVVSGKCNYQELDDKEVPCDECTSVNELGKPLEEQEQKEGCVYKTLISDECDKTRSFNFDIYHPIKDGNIIIKDEKCGKRMYWTDNYNPPRYIDLDELEKYKYIEDAVCDVPAKLKCEDCKQDDYVKCPNTDKMRIFPIYSKPCLEPDVIMVGGNLKMGTYEFLIAYCTKGGDEITPYMSITNPISVFDKQNSTMNQTNIADQTNFGIRLKVNELDKQYKYYKIVVIQRTDVNNNTSYFVEGVHPTTEDKIYYVREGEKRITLEQILQKKVYYEKTEGITESNNTLFHYGLTAHREWNLQPVVNFMGAFMKWSTMKADESLYEDGVNCSLYRGNMRDEVYPYGISFITNTGYKTAVFPLISRPAYRDEKRYVVNLPNNPTTKQIRAALKETSDANIRSINEYNPECSETNRLQVWQYYNTAGKGTYCQADPDEEFEFLNVDEDRKFSIKKVASFELNSVEDYKQLSKRVSFRLDVSGLSARKARELGVERTAYNNFFEYFKTLSNTIYETEDLEDLYALYKDEGDDEEKKQLWQAFCNFAMKGDPIKNSPRTHFETTFRSKKFNELLGINDEEAKNQFDIGIDPATQTGCNTPIYVPTEQELEKEQAEKENRPDRIGRYNFLSINEDEITPENFEEHFIYKNGNEMERSYECIGCRPYETDAETEEIVKARENPDDLDTPDKVKKLDQFNAHDVEFMYKYADWFKEGNYTMDYECSSWISVFLGCKWKRWFKKWHYQIARPKEIFLKRDLQQFTNVVVTNCNQIVGRALELQASSEPYENTIPFFFGNFGEDFDYNVAAKTNPFFLKYKKGTGKEVNIFEHSKNFSGNPIAKFISERAYDASFSEYGFNKGSLAFKAKFEEGVNRMFLELVPLSKCVRNNDYHTIKKGETNDDKEFFERVRETVRVTIFKDSTLRKILKHELVDLRTKQESGEDGIFIELKQEPNGFRKNQFFYIVIEPGFEMVKVKTPRRLTIEEQMINGVIDNQRRGSLNKFRDYLGNWISENPLTEKSVVRSLVPCGCFSVVLRKEEVKETNLTFSKIYLDRAVTFNFDCTHKVPLYKGCKPVDYMKGEMGYWESSFNYPDNKDLYDSSKLLIETSDIPKVYQAKFRQFYGKDGKSDKNINGKSYFDLDEKATQFFCKPIRHFRMPDNITAPFISGEDLNPFQRSLIYPLGVDLDPYVIHAFLNVAEKNGLLTNQERNSIVGYELHRGDRTLEKSIVAKGLLYDTYKYTENNKEVFYPNYPYNALGIDPLHFDENRKQLIDHPFESNRNNKFTFHSPETHFNKPTLPRELKVEGVQYGASKGVFAPVEDHSKWVVLGDKAFNKAYQLASAEVLFEKIVKAGELTVEASKNGWFVGGFSNGGGMVGAVISAVALGLTVHQMIEQANFKRNKLQYEWEKIFLDKGEPINFASYYTSVGWYNFLNADLAGDRKVSQSNGSVYFTKHSLRGLSTAKYLKAGRYSITENGANASYRFNNFQRESTVFLSFGKNTKNAIDYDATYKTYDYLDKEGNYLSSKDTAGSRGVRNAGVSRELTSQIASMYVQLRNYVPGQYGNIDSVQWLPTGFCGTLKLKAGTNSKTCTTAFGGDTFISRFSLKRKQPMFIANAMGLAPLTPFSYTKQMNIGRARFYADYLVTSELDVGSGMMPSLRSNINFDTDRKGLNGMYVEAPARFYLYYYGIPQFLVESEINCNFRYAKKEWHENFYPNVGDYVEWTQEKNVSIKKDNEFHYNQAYSKLVTPMGENKLPAIYDKKKWDCMNNAPNGVIASQTDNSEQDLNDPYLVYRPLDFYQFPKSYGKLIDMRGVDSASVLARFENTSAVFAAVDITQGKGQTTANYLLGNAGMFAQKPQVLSTNELGYAGTQHKTMVSSEAGYFWADAKRGQVLMFDGKSAQDITEGLRNWFKEQLPFKMLKARGEEDILSLDNPFMHHGLTMGWDSRYQRVFLTKLDYIPGELKTKEIEQTLRRYERVLNVETKQTIVDENDPNTYKEVEKIEVTFEEDRTKPPMKGSKIVSTFPEEPFYFFYKGEVLEESKWRNSQVDKSYLNNEPFVMFDKKVTDKKILELKEKVQGDNEKVEIEADNNVLKVTTSVPQPPQPPKPAIKDKTNVFVFIDIDSSEGMRSDGEKFSEKYINVLSYIVDWCYDKFNGKADEQYEGSIYLIGRCGKEQNFIQNTFNVLSGISSSLQETKDSLSNQKTEPRCGSEYFPIKPTVFAQIYDVNDPKRNFVSKFVKSELPQTYSLEKTLVISAFTNTLALGHMSEEIGQIKNDEFGKEQLKLKDNKFVTLFTNQDYTYDKYKEEAFKLLNTTETDATKEQKEKVYLGWTNGGLQKEGKDNPFFLYMFEDLKNKLQGINQEKTTFRHLLLPIYQEETEIGDEQGVYKGSFNGLRLFNSLFALEHANKETFGLEEIADYTNTIGVDFPHFNIKQGDVNPYHYENVSYKVNELESRLANNKETLKKATKNVFSVDYNLRFKGSSWLVADYSARLHSAIDKAVSKTKLFGGFESEKQGKEVSEDVQSKQELIPVTKKDKWVECEECPAEYPKKVVTKKYKVKEPLIYEVVTENVVFRTERVKKLIQEYERKQDASFTLAYSPLTKTWISYYDFKPAYYVNHYNYFQTGINYGNGSLENKDEIGLWSHLKTNESYQVFYGKRYPFTVELPIKEVYTNRILQNVEYWLEARRYHNEYDYAENAQIGFTKAWVYNNTNNSGQLNLYLAEKNNRFQQLQFPKFHSNSMDILTTNNDKKWTFNYFFNQVKNELNNVPIWNYDINAVEKVINEKAISYSQRMQDRLRGDWFFVRLSQDKESRFKTIFKWLSVKEKLYN